LKAVGKYRSEPHASPDGRQRVTGEFSTKNAANAT
jgi:hypothetical protein